MTEYPGILYEDNHIIAVNKSGHDLVQGDGSGDLSLDRKIRQYIKDRYGKPGNVFLGVVHRLDRPVTGVVLFARTSKALARLNAMFREGSIVKTYWAIVKNPPESDSGRLVHYILHNERSNKSRCYDTPLKGTKEASLRYRLIGKSDRYVLLEIDLETGRHHQIRAQLAHVGCAIKGDLKYGFPRSNPDGGISLHAREVRFIHPVTSGEVHITAPLPENDRLWESLYRTISLPM